MDLVGAFCADCDASNPQWASVNRGVLLCDDCSSIHRQLGRHVSQTKHLSKSLWRPTQLLMVEYLASAGANRFWEHLLLEPYLSKKADEITKNNSKIGSKPQPTAPLHPTKADFIREKYLFHGFFKSPRCIIPEDLNYQLHASVRTSVLETSLYLLAMGANPNFIHPAKGTSPMHVACQYEQVGQLELLIAYGGDVCAKTTNGVSVLKIALEKSSIPWSEQTINDHFYEFVGPDGSRTAVVWSQLIDCIISTFYELTDGFSFYLYRRIPNHKTCFQSSANCMRTSEVTNLDTNQTSSFAASGHFLVTPALHFGLTSSVDSRQARGKMTSLENDAFQDLCVDVYDEADRRYTNAILDLSADSDNKALQNGGNDVRPISTISNLPVRQSLALFFLPPNTAYSSVRNQARQKLGRLSAIEFRDLVVDVLTEAASRLVPILDMSVSALADQSIPIPKDVLTTSVRHNYSTYESLLCPSFPALNEKLKSQEFPANAVGLKLLKPASERPRRTSSKVATRNDAFEDPVYDQVPSEVELLNNSAASHPVQHDPLGKSCDVAVSTATDNLLLKSGQTQRKSISPAALFEMDVKKPSGLSESSTSPSELEATLAQCPGSRRIHLPSTSRLTNKRASVPGGLPLRLPSGPPPISADLTRAAILKSADLQCRYLEAKHEIEQLNDIILKNRRENETLSEQQIAWKTDKEALQNRIQSLEIACDQLREENSALRAAFSAGMVLSHKQSNGSLESSGSRENSPKSYQNQALDAVKSTTSSAAPKKPGVEQSSTSKVPAALELTGEESDYNDDPDEYSYNDDVSSAVSRATDRNYSVGNQCHDSGILLRQGISLWGTPSPSNLSETTQPPSSSSKVTTPQTARPATSISQVVKFTTTVLDSDLDSRVSERNQFQNQPTGNASACSSRAYSNMTPSEVQRNPVSVCVETNAKDRPLTHLNDIRTKSSNPPGRNVVHTTFPQHETEPSDDYTEPNETGSPSPAPMLPAPSHCKPTVQSTALWSPPASNLATCTHVLTKNNSGLPTRTNLKEHELPEYSSAHPKMQAKPAQTGSMHQSEIRSDQQPFSNWKQPQYERIVRGVECIIVRIRGLLEAANARHQSELSCSSKLIQLAVQDMVALFPPICKCNPTVGAALTTLLSNSQRLRLHCEHITNLDSAEGGAAGGGQTETNPLINFAHEIASAAKTILTFYQKERQ